MTRHDQPGAGVTVGIPFFSATLADQFRLSVDSILCQTLQPDVVHLIQDGPVSDDVSALAEGYCASHPNVERIVIPAWRGLPYALNVSILRTWTPYYARMDADDISHPDRLRRQVSFLEEHPHTDILGTWVMEFAQDPFREQGFLKRLPTEPGQIEAFFHYRNPLAHPSVMFRRSVFARIGLYDCEFATDQDLALWARALKMRVGIANLPEVLLFHRAAALANKRSGIRRVYRQARARFSYNTWSPTLNLLKVSALLFRLLPEPVRVWGYRRLR